MTFCFSNCPSLSLTHHQFLWLGSPTEGGQRDKGYLWGKGLDTGGCCKLDWSQWTPVDFVWSLNNPLDSLSYNSSPRPWQWQHLYSWEAPRILSKSSEYGLCFQSLILFIILFFIFNRLMIHLWCLKTFFPHNPFESWRSPGPSTMGYQPFQHWAFFWYLGQLY